jgi:hypothetical protein
MVTVPAGEDMQAAQQMP